jgi:hypothetical protein
MILADQAKPTKNVADSIIRHVFSFMRQRDSRAIQAQPLLA